MRVESVRCVNRSHSSLVEGNSTSQLTEKWREAMTLWHQGVVCQRFVGDNGTIRHLGSEEELLVQLRKGYQLRENPEGFVYLFRGVLGGAPGIEALEQKLDLKVEGKLSVFITYQWGQKELAKQVEAEFERKGYLVIRDESNLSHGAYIKGFMRIIAHPKLDYVIPVVSRGYLRSRNCMYEVNQVMNRYNWQATTLPIVIQNDPSDSANIYGGVHDYVEHWQKELESAKSDEDREVIDTILKNIRRFGEEVSGKLRIGEQELLSKSFSPLFESIEAHQETNAGTKFKKIDELLSSADYEAMMEDNEEAERLFKEALAALKEMRHLINTIGKPYAAKVHGKYGEFLLSIEKKEEGEKQLRAAAKLGYGSGEVKPSPSAHNASTSQVSGSTSSAPGIPSMAFGPAEWEKYFGEVDPAPPLPADIEEILNSSCHYWPTKKVSETHLLFYVPSQVDDKPLTLNSLGHLIQNPKGGGKKTKYRYYKDDLVKAYGSKVTEAHWVLMTRDVVPGSRKNTYLKQCDLSKGGDEPLHLLDATVGILMSHTMSGKRLFGDNPWTDTRCQEVYGGYQICVGSFSLDGLSLHNDWSGGDGCGLALARKF